MSLSRVQNTLKGSALRQIRILLALLAAITAISLAAVSLYAPPQDHRLESLRESLPMLRATGLPFCPASQAPALQPSDLTGHHQVILSWKASKAPKNSSIGYCLYRSKTKGAAEGNSTCGDCEQVNKVPVLGTSCLDDLVQDGTDYYYVVTAITNNGNASPSSNETLASIPATRQRTNANSSHPFCRGMPSK